MRFAAERRRQRLTTFLLACLVALFLSWAVLPATQPVRADDNTAKTDEDKPKSEQDSMPIHMLKSVGWVMGIVLGLLSVSLVALVVLLAMDVRMGDSVPPDFVEEFTEIVNKRRFKEAYELVQERQLLPGAQC